MKYKDFDIFGFTEDLIPSLKLEKVDADSENWFIFYKNGHGNWIKFYPFAEYHCGGVPYLINIGANDFGLWVKENENFVASVKEIINSKVQ